MKLSHCGEAVRLGDPDRFRTALFANPAQREHLFALYAFNLEIAKIAPMVSEPMLGEIRLEWWREIVASIFEKGTVRRHDVAEALESAIGDADLPRAPFDALIDARSADLDPAFPASEAALAAYIEDTAGGLMLLAAKALDTQRALSADGEQAIRNAGFAIGAARYLMAIPQLAEMGRRPLSIESADALAAEGRVRLAKAREARATIPKAVAPALLEASKAGHNLTSPKSLSPFKERLALYWNAATGRW